VTFLQRLFFILSLKPGKAKFIFEEYRVSTKIVVIGFIGALLGAGSGVVNIAGPVSYFLRDYGKSGLALFDLIPAILGVYLLFCAYIGIVGVILLKKFPRTGAGVLLGSAIAGYLMLVSIPIWGFAGIIEFVAAIMAFSEISRRKRPLYPPYPPYPPYGGYR